MLIFAEYSCILVFHKRNLDSFYCVMIQTSLKFILKVPIELVPIMAGYVPPWTSYEIRKIAGCACA